MKYRKTGSDFSCEPAFFIAQGWSEEGRQGYNDT
jgi:hypothetical protein